MEIAKLTGYCPATIYKKLRQAGAEVRSNKVNNRRYFVNHEFFDEIDSAEKAYWLGFLYADGSIGKYNGQSTMKVDLSSVDKDHLILLRNDLESNYPVRVFPQSTTYGEVNVCRLQVTSDRIVNSLINHGCTERKTKDLSPPLFLEEIYNRHFIRGFVDGDGSIAKSPTSKTGYRLKIVGTKAMLDWIKKNLPRAASVTGPSRNVYSLEAQSDSVLWLYEDSTRSLKRKYERYLIIKDQSSNI